MDDVINSRSDGCAAAALPLSDILHLNCSKHRNVPVAFRNVSAWFTLDIFTGSMH
jgi:hypothetical protein